MIDYHVHTKLCRHGEGELEDFVKSAIKKGLIEIGFNEHFPEEFLLKKLPKKFHHLIPIEDYSMNMEEFPQYVDQVLYLKEKYQDEISIKLGVEFDFLPKEREFIENQINKYEFDYIYGSIHQIFMENKPFAFDDSRFMKMYEDYDIDDCYEVYFSSLKELISSNLFDVASHLDLIKKYNKRPNDLNNYRKIITQIILTLEKYGQVIELNTAGARKPAKEFYPEDFILKEAHEHGIEFTLGSDAHHPEEVGHKFDVAIKKLKEIGFEYIIRFNKRNKEKYYI
ncbi:MAG: histidinol-phosphatase HisJ [Candidatus Lokiarchaeota archaeon]|nr:histidinol-phosphatase HisJ [Candidatus Lokiarchaeota archaeon]